MPTYAYACTACEHRFEIVQSFTEDSLTDCPQCQGRLRKLFNAVGVVFKGSGFYRTDSRNDSGRSSGKATSGKDSRNSSGKDSRSTSDTKGASSSSSESGSSSSADSSGSVRAPTTPTRSASKSEGSAA